MKRSTNAAAISILAGAALTLALALPASGAGDAPAAKAGGMAHEGHHDPMEEQITKARTPHDHEMLAGEYEAEAKSFDGSATNHENMAKAYTAFPGRTSGQSMAIHCRAIAKSLREAATQSRALAKFHREQAGKAN